MTDWSRRLPGIGSLELPGDGAMSPAESRVYRRCLGCGGYFRIDALKVTAGHDSCQSSAAPRSPAGVERRRGSRAAPRLAPAFSPLPRRRGLRG